MFTASQGRKLADAVIGWQAESLEERAVGFGDDFGELETIAERASECAGIFCSSSCPVSLSQPHSASAPRAGIRKVTSFACCNRSASVSLATSL